MITDKTDKILGQINPENGQLNTPRKPTGLSTFCVYWHHFFMSRYNYVCRPEEAPVPQPCQARVAPGKIVNLV